MTKAELVVADVGHESELVRHDSDKVRRAIAGIIAKEQKQKGGK